MKKIFAIVLLGVFMVGCSSKTDYRSKQFSKGEFSNSEVNMEMSLGRMVKMMKAFYSDKTQAKVPQKGEIPVVKLSRDDIIKMKNDSVVRMGHSTLLFKLDNRLVLTDPVFGERVSPVSFYGPKRFHSNPIEIEALPFIDIVIISHNHYDHLDAYSIKKLKDKVGHIYTTLGVSKKLIEFGVEPSKISELDWWQSKRDKSIAITATPAQHFSGRGLFDRNKSLWASWVIATPTTKLFFGADSGYFSGFKEIGKKFGAFDMTFLEAGAYSRLWKEVHMMPKESIQAHIDLKGKRLFAIHNGTFELAMHPWREPFERIEAEAKKQNVLITHPKMGEVIDIFNPHPTKRWWRSVVESKKKP
ncbi:MAG: MBL fold metallo-hydrolase [Campylobacterales bacterium]|nr:MBL fold metallo-hydrolase [Campylobacterales bacterium]